ncbi:hypothetical protein UACE39S_01736 [Ureibacillus acetophenoni]
MRRTPELSLVVIQYGITKKLNIMEYNRTLWKSSIANNLFCLSNNPYTNTVYKVT